MNASHDHRHARRPTWRFWTVVLLLFPLVAAMPTAFLIVASDDADGPWPYAAVFAALGLATVAILRERRIREMTIGRRAIWVGGGLAIGIMLACALALVIIFFALAYALEN